jgi:hypothetical protein
VAPPNCVRARAITAARRSTHQAGIGQCVRVSRSLWRALGVLAAVACLAWAAYLAFDWADYGADSTCGNFIRYKGSGGTCAEIMRNRVLGVIGLVTVAVVLLVVAALPWLRRRTAKSA